MTILKNAVHRKTQSPLFASFSLSTEGVIFTDLLESDLTDSGYKLVCRYNCGLKSEPSLTLSNSYFLLIGRFWRQQNSFKTCRPL